MNTWSSKAVRGRVIDFEFELDVHDMFFFRVSCFGSSGCGDTRVGWWIELESHGIVRRAVRRRGHRRSELRWICCCWMRAIYLAFIYRTTIELC